MDNTPFSHLSTARCRLFSRQRHAQRRGPAAAWKRDNDDRQHPHHQGCPISRRCMMTKTDVPLTHTKTGGSLETTVYGLQRTMNDSRSWGHQTQICHGSTADFTTIHPASDTKINNYLTLTYLSYLLMRPRHGRLDGSASRAHGTYLVFRVRSVVRYYLNRYIHLLASLRVTPAL